jgi:lipoprotein-releasing system ATP-binding protein
MENGEAEIVLGCEGLHRYLGQDENRVHVLDDVSLALHGGYVYSIMGPSGCGKSTLLYLLGLLDRPDEGSIRIAGHEVSGFDDHGLSLFRNQEIGFVFQFHFLLKEFTASENVQIPMNRTGAFTRVEAEDRAAYLLDLVGLGDKLDRQAHHLSGGEQQRVAIARAPANSERVFEVLQTLARETGLALLIVTHNTQVAYASDYIFNMQDGRLVE